MLPLLLFAAGGAIDFARWTEQRNNIKEVSDTLATLGAREFLLANASETNIRAIINAAVQNDLAANYDLGGLSHSVDVDMNATSVSVTISQEPKAGLILTNFVPYSDTISISSKAVARGGTKVCVVALEETGAEAFRAEMNAKLEAEDCSVLSNSVSTEGILATAAARIKAGLICSAGGYSGNLINFDPAPTTDCPIYDDPLITRSPDPVGPCDYKDVALGDPTIETSGLATVVSVADAAAGGLLSDHGADDLAYDSYTLNPGVFCGGLNLGSDADVTLNPGVYVMKDGPLAVALGGRLHGENVSFYLTGDNAVFYFGA